MLIRILVALLAAGALVVGCSDSGDSPMDSGNGGNGGGTPVSFANDIFPIIDSVGCTAPGCHGTGSSSGGLTLENGDYNSVRFGQGNSGPIVIPNDAASSNLYRRTTAQFPVGQRMPRFQDTLSTEQQNLIRDWINQGAQDN